MTGDHPAERLLAAYVSTGGPSPGPSAAGDRAGHGRAGTPPPVGAPRAGVTPDGTTPGGTSRAGVTPDGTTPGGTSRAGTRPGGPEAAPGALTADELWAVEAHLEGCAACRARLAVVVGEHEPAVTALLTAVRLDLEPTLAAVRPAPPRRRRPWPAAWATPAMAPWLVMITVITLAALLLDLLATHTLPIPPLLLVAPALPLLGVAAAWSRGLDPAFELTAVTPRSGLGLLLGRTLAVLLVLFPLLLAGGAITGVGTALWLLPALALTATALGLGSVIGVTRAVVVLGIGWSGAVLVPALALDTAPAVLQPEHFTGWALLLGLGAGVAALRRRAFALPGAGGRR
ncbi:zf-HC2 domain-containing protein [Streptomyces lonarensis]|uniref:Zf-HC2 domain-containing protein n=1 Tax=Streptomyces lonarensis TaxID=700599 RepID=A0A7X6HXM1_9ACTN|nr:zf-HC2 domain-containing protein [Streptomyces lonarensis]NJQ04721.1 zf-HC2 domain-containing protein [Streptomyces lonarensis]